MVLRRIASRGKAGGGVLRGSVHRPAATRSGRAVVARGPIRSIRVDSFLGREVAGRIRAE